MCKDITRSDLYLSPSSNLVLEQAQLLPPLPASVPPCWFWSRLRCPGGVKGLTSALVSPPIWSWSRLGCRQPSRRRGVTSDGGGGFLEFLWVDLHLGQDEHGKDPECCISHHCWLILCRHIWLQSSLGHPALCLTINHHLRYMAPSTSTPDIPRESMSEPYIYRFSCFQGRMVIQPGTIAHVSSHLCATLCAACQVLQLQNPKHFTDDSTLNPKVNSAL